MTTIILGMFLLVSVSAMYAGDCEQFDLSGLESLDNIVYAVVGNSSNLEGLNIFLNGSYVDICPSLNYKPDNFTLIFWDNIGEEVIKEVIIHHGGGGSIVRYVDRNVTEYVEVVKIIYVNETIEIEQECDDCIYEEEKVGFFESIWNWIVGLFR